MELEKQVCSLELAKRLKELGVKQKSYFRWSWYETNNSAYRVIHWDDIEIMDDEYAAFTVAELGEMMKTATTGNFIKAYHNLMETPYTDSNGPGRAIMAHNLMTEPDYTAKMLIYLIENKLITV